MRDYISTYTYSCILRQYLVRVYRIRAITAVRAHPITTKRLTVPVSEAIMEIVARMVLIHVYSTL